MAALTGHVSVRDPSGQTASFGPGDELPDWAAKQVTNPRLWEDGEVPFPAERPTAGEPASGQAPQGSEQGLADLEDRIVTRVLEGVGDLLRDLVAVVEDGDELADPAAESVAPVPPPRAGKGSGEDKWRAYAAEVGFDVTGIEDRNDIIAALESAGVPVE